MMAMPAHIATGLPPDSREKQAFSKPGQEFQKHLECISIPVSDIALSRFPYEGPIMPIGECCNRIVVADRDIDIDIEVVCAGLDADALRAGAIMTGSLVSVREQDGIFATRQLMRSRGIRRAPVIGDDGALIGIVIADDLSQLLAEEMSELSKLSEHARPRPGVGVGVG